MDSRRRMHRMFRFLLNTVHPSIAEVLLKIISLKYHPTVMASQGELAFEYLYQMAEKNKGKYFLVVEGTVQTAAKGRYCIVGERKGKEITFVELTKYLGRMQPPYWQWANVLVTLEEFLGPNPIPRA